MKRIVLILSFVSLAACGHKAEPVEPGLTTHGKIGMGVVYNSGTGSASVVPNVDVTITLAL